MQIQIVQAYKWYDTKLLEGAAYTVPAMIDGHELTVERAEKLIAQGIAKEVHL